MNLHASAASQRVMDDGSIWVEIRRNPDDASASHWLRALLPLSEAGLLPSDLKEREAMEHYESLVAIAQNISSNPPPLLMEFASMRPKPTESDMRHEDIYTREYRQSIMRRICDLPADYDAALQILDDMRSAVAALKANQGQIFSGPRFQTGGE